MFGRYGRHRHHPPSLGIALHIVDEEEGGTSESLIVAREEVLVAGKEIVLPDMRGEPCSTGGEHSPCRAIYGTCDTPEVGIVVCHPSTAIIHLLCGDGSRGTQVVDHVEERHLRLSEVAPECRPVVHLCIDVNGVFRVPWRIHLVVPHALQVGGLSARLR